jgi:hypothetical protein
MTKTKQIVRFNHIFEENDQHFVYGRAIKNKGNFFDLPIQSGNFDIFDANQLNNESALKKWPIGAIESKLFALPYKNKYVLHCES